MFHFLSPMMPSLSSLDAVFILHDGKCVFSQIANTLPECIKHSRAQHMFGTILWHLHLLFRKQEGVGAVKMRAQH